MTADRLARFTPAAGPDPGELLFRMGQAAAPTRPRWKLAVATLLLTNTAALAWIAARPMPDQPAPEVHVVPVVIPVPVPEAAAPEAWSLGALRLRDDPDRWPVPVPVANLAPGAPPLTPLAARRGEID